MIHLSYFLINTWFTYNLTHFRLVVLDALSLPVIAAYVIDDDVMDDDVTEGVMDMAYCCGLTWPRFSCSFSFITFIPLDWYTIDITEIVYEEETSIKAQRPLSWWPPFLHIIHIFEIWNLRQVCLFVFHVPSTARSFRDDTPVYCPLRRTYTVPTGNRTRVVAWQSITLTLRHTSSTT